MVFQLKIAVLGTGTAGANPLAALEAVGAANLAGKVLPDLALPLDFSQGMPPLLLVANTDSLGEQMQRTFPTRASSRRRTQCSSR